jgi:glycerate kinase
MVEALDRGLEHFSSVVRRVMGRDIAEIPGAGAAGGLGGGFLAFTNARLARGVEMVLDAIGFDRMIRSADLVITGEGRVDFQTLTGKTPYGVLKRARKQNIPVIAIGGSVTLSDEEVLKAGFAGAYAVTPAGMPLEEAMKADVASHNVTSAVASILKKSV